jgi:hypothetical protein
MEYLRSLRRVSESQLKALIGELQSEPEPGTRRPSYSGSARAFFQILNYIEERHQVGRNWVAQCPSCAAVGHDRARDNLSVSIEEPWKYLCWAGCTKEQIRAALGRPVRGGVVR